MVANEVNLYLYPGLHLNARYILFLTISVFKLSFPGFRPIDGPERLVESVRDS